MTLQNDVAAAKKKFINFLKYIFIVIKGHNVVLLVTNLMVP